MTNQFRLFQRASGVWYAENTTNRQQHSLRTHSKTEAERFLQATNEAHRMPAINLQIARAYITASDPELARRTWQEVMNGMVAARKGENGRRWRVAIKDHNFDLLRKLPLLETRADHFLKVLADRKVSTNIYLRRIHNFALAMDWLLKAIIPKAQWPKVTHKSKTAITLEQHLRIVDREKNPERRALYQLCWHLGGSQMDIANLLAEDVDWNDQTICYSREKLKNREETTIKPPLIHFGEEVSAILRTLPATGPLFPNLRTVQSKDRANEFRQRCHGLGITGVSLHCYRNSWAERARKAGYPERFAQEALGHNSKTVHRAYAKKAEVRIDSLDAWEKKMNGKLVPVQFQQTKPG
jgi:hypothetical protein